MTHLNMCHAHSTILGPQLPRITKIKSHILACATGHFCHLNPFQSPFLALAMLTFCLKTRLFSLALHCLPSAWKGLLILVKPVSYITQIFLLLKVVCLSALE